MSEDDPLDALLRPIAEAINEGPIDWPAGHADRAAVERCARDVIDALRGLVSVQPPCETCNGTGTVDRDIPPHVHVDTVGYPQEPCPEGCVNGRTPAHTVERVMVRARDDGDIEITPLDGGGDVEVCTSAELCRGRFDR